MVQAVEEEYTTSLEDLTFNSKPHINVLTMLADENKEHADVIVRLIETKLEKSTHQAPPNCKLPVMYLMDSIVKNVGGNYKPLFAKNIVKNFVLTFQQGDDKVKMSLYKLRATWDDHFPLKKLYELDISIRSLDAAWPVKPLPATLQEKSTSIHVNPKFLKKAVDSSDLQQDLINKKKQLLELQQQKLLLELEQTKQQLALREKKSKQAPPAIKDPRVKAATGILSSKPGFKVTLTNGKPQKSQPRDPRLTAPKVRTVNQSASRKSAAIDSHPQLEESKETPEHDKSKTVSKKVIEKKKKSPPNGSNKSKTALLPGKQPSKNIKTEQSKKLKESNKTDESKAVKKLLDDPRKPEIRKTSRKNEIDKVKEVPHNRVRPVKRSSPRPQYPPAKIPKRSNSIERQRPDPSRQDTRSRQRPVALRNEDMKRFSPISREGSLSPRFSPEPDDSPSRNDRGLKRPRPQNFPRHAGPGHMMPGHGPPVVRRRPSVEPNLTIPQELTLSHQAEILKQAEIQLQTGQLTHSQHQDLLKQLHQLFELQRLRSVVGAEPNRHRLPLDDLLPPQPQPESMPYRGEDFRPPPSFRDEFPPGFRPPPSPPMMDSGPDGLIRRGPHDRLTPPPMPPMADPRRNRGHFSNNEDRRRPMHDHPNTYHRVSSNPEIRRLPLERNVDRRQSPPMRRPSASWDDQESMHHNSFGQDAGNVFVLDDQPENRWEDQHPQEHVHEVNESGPPANDHPVHVYEDHNKMEDNENPQMQQSPQRMDSDNEESRLQFEEPEDYIIANIPQGAEAYHNHSIRLKKGANKPHKLMTDQESSETSLMGKIENDAPEQNDAPERDAPMSPDASLREKLEDVEDICKSPSLPLKKRKYVVSTEGVEGNSGTEPDSEFPEKSKEATPPPEGLVIKVEPEALPEEKNIADIMKHEEQEEKKPHINVPENIQVKKENSPVPEEAAKANDDIGGTGITPSDSAKTPENDPVREDSVEKVRNESEEKIPPQPGQSQDNKGRMRRKRERKEKKQQPNRNRRPVEEDRIKFEEERRLEQLMIEEEERLRWEAELERELGREEFQERERRERAMRGSPPRRPWGREDGPWRGRGPPPPGRGRRWGREELWEKEPPRNFPGRLPPGRHPPRRHMDDLEWQRWEDHRRGRPPMMRRMDDRPPPRDWHPRGMQPGNSPSHPEPLPPPPPPTQAPVKTDSPDINQVNVNKLLSDLLSMGIIPGASKTNEAAQPAKESTPPSEQAPKTSDETAKKEEVKVTEPVTTAEEKRVPTPVFGNLLSTDPNANLPELSLEDMDKLKIRHEEVIDRLYTGIQCSACGMRFTACQTDMYAEHLDWHYRLNRKDKDGLKATHRNIFPTAGEWIMYEEIVDPSQRAKSQVFDEPDDASQGKDEKLPADEQEPAVPVAQNPEQDKCTVCNEAFTTVYNDEDEEWQYIRCVAVDGKNFHPDCYADHKDHDDENAPPPPTPIRVPLYNPLTSAVGGIPGLDSLTNDVEMEEKDIKLLDSEMPESKENIESEESTTPSNEDEKSSDVKAENVDSPVSIDQNLPDNQEPQNSADQSSNEPTNMEVQEAPESGTVPKLADEELLEQPTVESTSQPEAMDATGGATKENSEVTTMDVDIESEASAETSNELQQDDQSSIITKSSINNEDVQESEIDKTATDGVGNDVSCEPKEPQDGSPVNVTVLQNVKSNSIESVNDDDAGK